MSGAPIDAFLERDAFALEDVAEAIVRAGDVRATDLSLARLIELGARLPSGLAHAESISLFAEPPPGLVPLADGSAWFAAGSALAAVPRRSRSAVRAMITDLATYLLIAERFRIALQARPELVAALAEPELDAGARMELALALDAPATLLAALDVHAPALRSELAVIASRAFRPTLRIHAALRASHLSVRGARLAQELLAQLPAGPVRLLIADTPLALEHLSPYVRDLGIALSTWGVENQDRLVTGGLAEALIEAGERVSVDLAALVAKELLEAHPELLLERREAERSAGLYLFDAEDVAFGFAELSRLALPDERAVPRGVSGTIALLATCAEATMLEVARLLLESGRVSGVALVLAAAVDVPGVIVAENLVATDDAVVLSRSEEIAERAARLGIETHRMGSLSVDDALGAPEVARELSGLVRRASALGKFTDEDVAVVLYPLGREVSQRAYERRLLAVEAGRLALSFLLDPGDTANVSKTRQGVSHKAPGVSRRFRA